VFLCVVLVVLNSVSGINSTGIAVASLFYFHRPCSPSWPGTHALCCSRKNTNFSCSLFLPTTANHTDSYLPYTATVKGLVICHLLYHRWFPN